ncbi:unnamed protein product, partial [Phaeothamnion confervicola]
RDPAAELLVWSVPDGSEPPLSLAAHGAANAAVTKFNPMQYSFTLLDPRALPPPPGAGGGMMAMANGDTGGVNGGALVVCKEMCTEARHALQLPLQFLNPLHSGLRCAERAWKQRLERERQRQGFFKDHAAAFAHGQWLVRFSVLEARGLEAVAPPEAPPQSPPAGSMREPSASSTGGGGDDGSGDNGEGGGGGKTPGALRLADVRRLGGKAMAMAKNATSANVAGLRTARLGGSSGGSRSGGGGGSGGNITGGGGGGSADGSPPPYARSARTAHYFAKLAYIPPAGGVERYVGRTNTEYANFAPVFNSNAGRINCPHTKPRTRHTAAGAASLEEGPPTGPGLAPATAAAAAAFGVRGPRSAQFRFYCPAAEVSGDGASEDGANGGSGSGALRLVTDYDPTDRVGGAAGGDAAAGAGSVSTGGGGSSPGGAERTAMPWGGYGGGRAAPASSSAAAAAVVAAAAGGGDIDDENEDDDDEEEEELTLEALAANAGSSPVPSPRLSPERSGFFGVNVSYPPGWVEQHIAAVSSARQRLASAMDVCSAQLATRIAFRSSAHKKDRNLQFVATNLHNQVCSAAVLVPTAAAANGGGYSQSNGVPTSGTLAGTVHYDFVTTGAPSAHALGFGPKGDSGLVTLEMEVAAAAAVAAALRTRLWEAKARAHAAAVEGDAVAGMAAATATTGASDELRAALLGWEERVVELAVRRAVVCSQAVSIVAACFAARVEMAALGTLDGALGGASGGGRCGAAAAALAARWTAHGFLVGFEAVAAAAATAASAGPLQREDVEMDVAVSGRQIQLAVGPALLRALPPGLVGRPIKIVPVFFTQGIDIQQSVSHASGGTAKAAFQARVNAASFAKLNRYVHSCFPAASGAPIGGNSYSGGHGGSGAGGGYSGGGGGVGYDGSAGNGGSAAPAGGNGSPPTTTAVATGEMTATHPLLRELEKAVTSQQLNAKNYAVLLASAAAVRAAGGARVTFCKSGKDRTAMSVTLEESMLVAQRFRLAGVAAAGGASGTGVVAAATAAVPLANVLRALGVRIAVAEKNVGRPKYSFNAIQRQFLPELYRAPLQTINDVITSAMNRDS